MKRLNYKFTSLLLLFLSVAFSGLFISCDSEDEPIRSENDILGVWTQGDDRYISFEEGNRAPNLYVKEQEGMTIGVWEQDGYFYEPGYQLLIYIDKSSNPGVYKVVELTETRLVTCWVENLMDKYNDGESIGQIIGDIINNAQQGYELDPANYAYYEKVPENEFYELLESILVMPW